MNVLFIPDYSKANPYQRALADSLSREGIKVSIRDNFRLFSVLSSTENHWKPDILHIHWSHPFFSRSSREKTILEPVKFIIKLIILKFVGIKIVWTVHNITSHEGRYKSLELFFCKLLAKICNKIIVHSNSIKDEIMKAYSINQESSIVVIPHGNYISCYKNTINKVEARRQLQINKRDIVFLYFGLIRSYKGVLELIGVFKKLNHSKIKLIIAGKPFNNKIAEEIRKKCNKNERIETFLKFIPDDEIQIYMNVADIVVLPYREILTSGVIILAMSFGKPIIAPKLGCIPDYIDDNGGFLYNPLDIQGLLEVMHKAIYSPDLKKMGEYNFRKVKGLNWKRIGENTYRIYRRFFILKKRGRLKN